jgi:cytoskeletal protein RodZ
MAKDLGDRLRQAREALGVSVDDITARTKIPARALMALEAEAFDRLPRGVVRRAYLRTYATALGLDAEECVHTYVDRWEPPPPPEPEPRLSSWTDDRLRALLGVIVVVGVLAATSVIVLFWRDSNSVDPSPRVVTAAARAETPPASPSPVPQTPAPVVSTPPLRVQIQATSPCWISATADNQRAVRRLVGAGETLNIDAASAIVLHLGDAGAVATTINGARGRALGRRGEMVTVTITPKTYESFLAPTGGD